MFISEVKKKDGALSIAFLKTQFVQNPGAVFYWLLFSIVLIILVHVKRWTSSKPKIK